MLSAFVALNIVIDLLISRSYSHYVMTVTLGDEQTTSFSFSNEILNRLEISVAVQVETPQHFYANTLQFFQVVTVVTRIGSEIYTHHSAICKKTRSCKTSGRR